MARRVVPPLRPGWVIVDDRPMFHRWCRDAPDENGAIVHVHGFGISGHLPRAGRRVARGAPSDVRARPSRHGPQPAPGAPARPARARSRPGSSYCDAVGVERATFVGNSLGCPIIVELATTFPERIDRVVLDLAGRGAEQPAPPPGARPDGQGLVSRAAVDGADRRPRLPPVRRAAELDAVPGDEQLRHAGWVGQPGHADAGGRRRPRSARPHRPGRGLRRLAPRRGGQDRRRPRPQLQSSGGGGRARGGPHRGPAAQRPHGAREHGRRRSRSVPLRPTLVRTGDPTLVRGRRASPWRGRAPRR